MIGKKVSSMCLDNAELNFYRWDGELSDLLGKVLKHTLSARISGTAIRNAETLAACAASILNVPAGVVDARSGGWCR